VIVKSNAVAGVSSTSTETSIAPTSNVIGPIAATWNRITSGVVWWFATLIVGVRSSKPWTVSVVPSGFTRVSGQTVVSRAGSVRPTE
jgi:hypothetical protein